MHADSTRQHYQWATHLRQLVPEPLIFTFNRFRVPAPTRAHLRRTAHEPNADRTKRSEAGKPALTWNLRRANRSVREDSVRRSGGPMGYRCIL
jgi:hypothetical protein